MHESLAQKSLRAWGMPGARCTRSLAWEKIEPHEHSHHRFTGVTRHSRTRWFTTYIALSPVIGLGCHRHRRDTSRLLDASIETSGPHDFAVREKRASSGALSRPPHPAPRFVTLRNAPRSEQDGASGRFDLPDGESTIFLPMGLDRPNQRPTLICPSGRPNDELRGNPLRTGSLHELVPCTVCRT